MVKGTRQVAGIPKVYRPKVKGQSPKFTEAQTKLLCELFNQVWQYIGADVETAMAEAGERLTNDVVIETVLDASRPQSYIDQHYRGNEDMAMGYALFKTMKYPDQCKWVVKHCGRFV